jgi:2-polyprenyl-6-methoxyphenol hydroxylase-like FAD-dependent oxidoreductase
MSLKSSEEKPFAKERIHTARGRGNLMASGTYDIITVGGGLGGATLAKAIAEHGACVLVLERERQLKDWVRGEGMHAWGVPEARALGIYELLRETCGVEVRWWDTCLQFELIDHRAFIATTPHHSPLYCQGAERDSAAD